MKDTINKTSEVFTTSEVSALMPQFNCGMNFVFVTLNL